MAAAETGHIVYAPTAANPHYDAVTALPYRPHDRKVSYGDHPDQFGLLWLPGDGLSSGKPTVVLVHGGCWLNAYDITHTSALATALASIGYPVWNLEYRRADDMSSAWPASLEDLQRGLAAMEQLAHREVSVDNVIIIGHSAGGHLALLLAAYLQQDTLQTLPSLSVVGLAAITDIARYAEGDNSCQQATALFMGGTPDAIPEAYAAANPSGLRITVPVTLLHGDSDQVVPGEQQERLQGERVTRVLAQGAGHFDWIHPGTPAFQILRQTLARLHGNH
jgi:acetyl esterase/lipase